LAQHVVSFSSVRRLRTQHVVEETATSELAEKTAEAAEIRRLSLFLEAAENRGEEGGCATLRLRFTDAQLACHRLQTAGLGEEFRDIHSVLLVGFRAALCTATILLIGGRKEVLLYARHSKEDRLFAFRAQIILLL